MPDDVVYRSRVRVERVAGSTRHAFLPTEQEPVLFSVHDEIAQHYGRAPGTYEPHAATLDYLVAATAGWLVGTLGGALEARKIPASERRLVCEAVGEVEKENKVLVLRRIHVRYHLQLRPDQHEAALRAHEFHVGSCPVALTIRGCVDVTTELEMEDVEA